MRYFKYACKRTHCKSKEGAGEEFSNKSRFMNMISQGKAGEEIGTHLDGP